MVDKVPNAVPGMTGQTDRRGGQRCRARGSRVGWLGWELGR